VAQPGSAPGLGPGGRRFESCLPDLRGQSEITPALSFFIFPESCVQRVYDAGSFIDPGSSKSIPVKSQFFRVHRTNYFSLFIYLPNELYFPRFTFHYDYTLNKIDDVKHPKLARIMQSTGSVISFNLAVMRSCYAVHEALSFNVCSHFILTRVFLFLQLII
jgi:hypothetical protein